jgi:protein RecA
LSLKDKIISKTIDALNEQFGSGSAQTLSDGFTPEKEHGFIPTDNLAIDWVIGRPGIPLGRVTEIAGKPGSGKSSIVASIIASAQKSGAIGVLIDSEKSYHPNWARIHKVDPESLIYLDPPHLEGVFDQAAYVIKQIKEAEDTVPVFLAIDSVSANPTASELEQEDSTASRQAAEHAKVISAGLRKISKLLWEQNVALLFVSQLKDNPRSTGWANTKSKIGGNAIWFHAALMLEVARTAYRTEKDDEGKRKIGQTIQISSVKNKFVTDPHRICTFDLYYEEGFKSNEIAVDFMVQKEVGLAKKSGGWYEFEGSKFHKEDLALKVTPEIIEDIYKKLQIK